MFKRFILLLSFVLCLGSVPAAEAGEAADQLRQSIDKVLSILQDPRLKAPQMKAQRRDKIFNAVEERFDFGEMAKRSMSEYWQQLSPAEQKEFQESFSRLLENSYISKVEKYSDEKVNYNNEKAKGSRYYLVSTTIVSQGQSIPLDYSLHNVHGQWMVYDVNIEGVSLVTNYCSQFRELMRRDGFKGLMNKIDEKLRKIDES